MAVEYTIVTQKNPRNPQQSLNYPRAVSSGVVDLEEIIHKLEMTSTVSGADIVAVIRGLTDLTVRELADGKTVRLGDLGSFRITLQAEACSSKEEGSSRAIKGARVVFSPGNIFKRMLRSLKFMQRKA